MEKRGRTVMSSENNLNKESYASTLPARSARPVVRKSRTPGRSQRKSLGSGRWRPSNLTPVSLTRRDKKMIAFIGFDSSLRSVSFGALKRSARPGEAGACQLHLESKVSRSKKPSSDPSTLRKTST